jgi:hypothetical protein
VLRGLLTLGAVLLIVAVLWCAAVVTVMAYVLLRPRRMSDARGILELGRLCPSDLGLEYEETAFTVVDEQSGGKLRIAAWWIPNPLAAGRCAVLVHGYSDSKNGAIAWAPLLHGLGWAILAPDMRAHGESGGKYCTAGFWERHDLNQVIDQLKLTRPQQARQLIVYGISTGAAVSAAAAAGREDLAAVILECPYADFRHSAMFRAVRLGMPGPLFQGAALWAAQWLARCDFSAVRPVDMIARIACPLLVIEAGEDQFVCAADRRAIAAAVAARPPGYGPGVYWESPAAHHVLALAHDPAEYRRRIEQFLANALQNAPAICDK